MVNTVYGANYTKAFVNFPPEKTGVGENISKIHSSYEKFTFTAIGSGGAGEFAAGDTIYAMKLPANARVIDVYANCASLGTTGMFDIGWLANGVDSVDLDGFVVGSTNFDMGGQADTVRMSDQLDRPGQFVKFGAETQVVLTCTEATTACTAVVLELVVLFAMA